MSPDLSSLRYPVRVPLQRKPIGVIVSALAARRNLLELIPGIATRQPMVSGRTGARWHMVMDPEALRRVLKDRVEDYPKSLITRLILEPAIGNSLFVAEGAHWRWQRLAAAPALSQRHVEALAPVMTAAAEACARRLAAASGRVEIFFRDRRRNLRGDLGRDLFRRRGGRPRRGALGDRRLYRRRGAGFGI